MQKIFHIFILFFILIGCSSQEFGGIGIEVPTGKQKVTNENPFIVVNVIEGGPAYNAGIKPGDIIISVDGIPVNGKRYEYVVNNLLRGKVGSMVTLEINRNGKLHIFRVMRRKIVLK